MGKPHPFGVISIRSSSEEKILTSLSPLNTMPIVKFLTGLLYQIEKIPSMFYLLILIKDLLFPFLNFLQKKINFSCTPQKMRFLFLIYLLHPFKRC